MDNIIDAVAHWEDPGEARLAKPRSRATKRGGDVGAGVAERNSTRSKRERVQRQAGGGDLGRRRARRAFFRSVRRPSVIVIWKLVDRDPANQNVGVTPRRYPSHKWHNAPSQLASGLSHRGLARVASQPTQPAG